VTTILQAKCVLLDIEGTISDIRFVYDVMFPYARDNMRSYLIKNWGLPDLHDAVGLVAHDANIKSIDAWLGLEWKHQASPAVDILANHLLQLMASDSKSTGLKQLQGKVWQSGFESGAIQAELFADVLPALQFWKGLGLDLRIYSSGSVLAQKMFFQHTVLGDLSDLFTGHYDTSIGSKKEEASYVRIANESQFEPRDIVFVTDVLSELIAASQAGMQVVASVRPNNLPLPAEFAGLRITSFSQLEFSNHVGLSRA
jgi:enolase-phosphatase E1